MRRQGEAGMAGEARQGAAMAAGRGMAGAGGEAPMVLPGLSSIEVTDVLTGDEYHVEGGTVNPGPVPD